MRAPNVRGLRLPGLTVAVFGLVALGVLVLAPSVDAWAQQRQAIADLRAEVAQQQADLESTRADVARWDDPAYVRAQARERLFYVMPGETGYLVIADGATAPEPAVPPSTQVEAAEPDWAAALLGSLIAAGTTDQTVPGAPATESPAPGTEEQ